MMTSLLAATGFLQDSEEELEPPVEPTVEPFVTILVSWREAAISQIVEIKLTRLYEFF